MQKKQNFEIIKHTGSLVDGEIGDAQTFLAGAFCRGAVLNRATTRNKLNGVAQVN